jgi:hypothetical protein
MTMLASQAHSLTQEPSLPATVSQLPLSTPSEPSSTPVSTTTAPSIHNLQVLGAAVVEILKDGKLKHQQHPANSDEPKETPGCKPLLKGAKLSWFKSLYDGYLDASVAGTVKTFYDNILASYYSRYGFCQWDEDTPPLTKPLPSLAANATGTKTAGDTEWCTITCTVCIFFLSLSCSPTFISPIL